MGGEQSPAWQALQVHCDSGMGSAHLSALFNEVSRTEQFSLEL